MELMALRLKGLQYTEYVCKMFIRNMQQFLRTVLPEVEVVTGICRQQNSRILRGGYFLVL